MRPTGCQLAPPSRVVRTWTPSLTYATRSLVKVSATWLWLSGKDIGGAPSRRQCVPPSVVPSSAGHQDFAQGE